MPGVRGQPETASTLEEIICVMNIVIVRSELELSRCKAGIRTTHGRQRMARGLHELATPGTCPSEFPLFTGELMHSSSSDQRSTVTRSAASCFASLPPHTLTKIDLSFLCRTLTSS